MTKVKLEDRWEYTYRDLLALKHKIDPSDYWRILDYLAVLYDEMHKRRPYVEDIRDDLDNIQGRLDKLWEISIATS